MRPQSSAPHRRAAKAPLQSLWTLALTALALPTVAQAGDGGIVLTPKQESVYREVLQEEFCGCQSALTVAGCLEQRKSCKLAKDISLLVRKSAMGDVGADEVLAYLAKRVMGPYCKSPKGIAIDGAPMKGNPNAPVTIVEFADFRCGHCRHAAPVLAATVAKHKEHVRLVFMPFPLNDNPISVAAATAALAAGAQGKFWPMHDALFAQADGDFSPRVLKNLARKIGLDLARFERDMKDPRYPALIKSFKERGLQAGVQGTPAIFVNGREYDLDPTLFTLADRIAMERHRDQGNCQ